MDSNDKERLIEAREELERMTQEDELRDAILLVFANKQDLPSVCSVADVADALGLQGMRNRQVGQYFNTFNFDFIVFKLLMILTVGSLNNVKLFQSSLRYRVSSIGSKKYMYRCSGTVVCKFKTSPYI